MTALLVTGCGTAGRVSGRCASRRVTVGRCRSGGSGGIFCEPVSLVLHMAAVLAERAKVKAPSKPVVRPATTVAEILGLKQ